VLRKGEDSVTQIKSFSDFERRKELDSGAAVEECCHATGKRLSANRKFRRSWSMECSGVGEEHD